MSEELARVTVRILDKEYQVACPDDERDALLESAGLLNRKMREIRESGKIVGLDRIAVLAALNLSHEILQNQHSVNEADQSLLGRLRMLNDRLALAGASGGQTHLHSDPRDKCGQVSFRVWRLLWCAIRAGLLFEPKSKPRSWPVDVGVQVRHAAESLKHHGRLHLNLWFKGESL